MAISYIAGTFISAIAGKIGIEVATIANAKSAEDIKLNKFPEEELFSSLINPEQTRATKGILGCYRENLEPLYICIFVRY